MKKIGEYPHDAMFVVDDSEVVMDFGSTVEEYIACCENGETPQVWRYEPEYAEKFILEDFLRDLGESERLEDWHEQAIYMLTPEEIETVETLINKAIRSAPLYWEIAEQVDMSEVKLR